MKYALTINVDKRIQLASIVLTNGNYGGMPIVDTLPEGDITEYRYIDGQYIHDPLPKPEPVEPVEEPSVWDELDAAYQEGVDSV